MACQFSVLRKEPDSRMSIPQKLLDQVDVGHDHASAAVAVQLQLVHRLSSIEVSETSGRYIADARSYPS